MTRFDKYLFTANTASHTISRLIGTGNDLFVDNPVAATIPTGGAPADLDAADDLLAIIDGAAGVSHTTVFDMNEFGDLSGARSATVGPRANGVAIMPAAEKDD